MKVHMVKLNNNKVLIFIFSGVFILSALVTLLFLVLRNTPADEEIGQYQAPQRELGILTAKELSFGDFITDLDLQDSRQEDYYLFRKRFESWSEEQVDRFWIPLHDITVDILVKKNDELVEKLFKDIP
jgi:hypothetical protein